MAKFVTEFMEEDIMVQIEKVGKYYNVIYKDYFNATWNFMTSEKMTKGEIKDHFGLAI